MEAGLLNCAKASDLDQTEFSQYDLYVLYSNRTSDEYSSIGRTIVMYRCRVTNGLLNYLLHRLKKPSLNTRYVNLNLFSNQRGLINRIGILI